MIIIRISDGLGNQMFQLAAGLAVSAERGASLRLDISCFADDRMQRRFELNRVFSCAAEIAGKADVRRILGWQHPHRVRRIMSRRGMAMLRRKELVIEPHFHYWPEINHVPSDCYLAGYWQSEKYFQKHTDEVRVRFTFKHPLTDNNAEIAEQISRVNAVSLHIRRGDYVSDSGTRAKHGVCLPGYYEKAIHYLAKRVESPHFFVFSDDMDWVRFNLKISHPCCFVAHNRGEESYNDMHLMSLCRYHIIANSSFSWWGAWLNPDKDKIVVAPERWFNNHPVYTGDIFPAGWITM